MYTQYTDELFTLICSKVYANVTAVAFHKATSMLLTAMSDGSFFLHEMPSFTHISSLRYCISFNFHRSKSNASLPVYNKYNTILGTSLIGVVSSPLCSLASLLTESVKTWILSNNDFTQASVTLRAQS